MISVSGLRGVVGESLTPEVAMRYACAFAMLSPPGPLVISRDGRRTGPLLADALRSGLQAVGRTTIDAGVASTPTTGVLVRQLSAAGGVQISASHNPAEYNGLKLFSGDGRVIPAGLGQQVVIRYRAGGVRWADHRSIGEARVCPDSLSEHARLVLGTVDVGRIRGRRLKVVLDSNHGAGSLLGRHLLDELGCEVMVLGGEPDGLFAHPPEPTAENLAGVLAQVAAAGADVGFCQDPDADRLAIIDEQGRYLGEESTLALCVDHVLAGDPGPIAINCSTSRMSEDLAARHKVPCFRSAVGEANVVDAMIAHDAVLGGEGNGGVIDPRVGLVRDSFAGMALVLDGLAARGGTISQWASELPRYEIVKLKATVRPEKVPAALEALARHFGDAEADRLDGLRLDWPGKWLLVRPSNTEPVVRAIAEAPTIAEAQQLCDEAVRLLNKG